jgi:hypothetical protein
MMPALTATEPETETMKNIPFSFNKTNDGAFLISSIWPVIQNAQKNIACRTRGELV